MRIIDPRGRGPSDQNSLAPRLQGFRGRIGFLTNGKPNATKLLQAIEKRFAAHPGVTGFLWLDKSRDAEGPGASSTEWMFQALSSGTIAVLAASGD